MYNKELKEVISIQSFGPIKDNKCHTGSQVRETFWNTGLIIETRSKILKYLFNILKLHKIYCEIREDNIRSQKLIEKYGFQKKNIKK